MMNQSPVKIDVLLEPLLTEVSDVQADEILSQLITVHAEPVIKGVIRFKLRLNSFRETQREEADDIHQEVVLQLLTQLQRFRKLPDDHPITDLRGMAAVIAHRACSRWMRRQFPERHALKNRLHYLLTRQRGFALWQDEDKKLIAGFGAWQGQRKPENPRLLVELSDNERLIENVRLLESGKRQKSSNALAAIFDHLGGPIEFDELVSCVASLLQIRDQPIESTGQNSDTVAFEAAGLQPDPA